SRSEAIEYAARRHVEIGGLREGRTCRTARGHRKTGPANCLCTKRLLGSRHDSCRKERGRAHAQGGRMRRVEPWLLAVAVVTGIRARAADSPAHPTRAPRPPPPPRVVRDHGRQPPPGDSPREAPPPPHEEKFEARAGFVWAAGRWDWRGGKWEWLPGHW